MIMSYELELGTGFKDSGYIRGMMRMLIILAMTVLSSTVFSQNLPVYKDAKQPIDKRVSDLLSRMTPEEKFFQLFMIPGEIPAGKEDQYRNGLFGFQVSAAQKKGDAGAQMLDYGVQDDAKAVELIHHALDLGITDNDRLSMQKGRRSHQGKDKNKFFHL